MAKTMEDYASKILGMSGALHRIHDKIWNPSAASSALESIEAQFQTWKRLDERLTHASAIDRMLKRDMAIGTRLDGLDFPGRMEERAWRSVAMYGSAAFVEQELFRRDRFGALMQRPAWQEALEVADRASRCFLPDALEQHRTFSETLAFGLVQLRTAPWWQEGAHLDAFAQASATADALRGGAVGGGVEAAVKAFTSSPIPALPGLADHRFFLDAAGLWLLRWPRIRLLSRAEKRSRFKRQLGENAEPKHVRRAKSLVHRYELMLRRVIDWVMTEAYGEEWWVERLPECGCKDLLGRWQKEGGNVLDLADYAHYARIMIHPEHFAAGFYKGFPDQEALTSLIARARKLRGASHHGSEDSVRFRPQDLYDLRATWIALEEGLISLWPDSEMDC
jgi:hypothetical protein